MSGLLRGPGWFNDVFDVQVVFHTDKRSMPSAPDREDDLELYFDSEAVAGSVRVTAPPGRRVWQSGITARLESVISYYHTLQTKQLVDVEVTIAEPGYVEGTFTVPFEFHNHGLHDSYEGENFGVRHGVLITVLRPWYTFDVVTFAPFAVQAIASEADLLQWIDEQGRAIEPPGTPTVAAPPKDGTTPLSDKDVVAEDAGGRDRVPSASGSLWESLVPAAEAKHPGAGVGAGVGSGTPSPDPEVKPNLDTGHGKEEEASGTEGDDVEVVADDDHLVVISDCGGLVVFDYNQPAYALDSMFEGEIRFSQLSKPVVRVELMLLKIEGGEVGAVETTPFHEVLMDHRQEGPDNEPFEVEGALSVQLDLSRLPLSPTFVIEHDTKEGAASPPPDAEEAELDETFVRFYVRVVVFTDVEKPEKFWNTNEVLLYRAESHVMSMIPGTPSRAAESSAKHADSPSATPRHFLPGRAGAGSGFFGAGAVAHGEALTGSPVSTPKRLPARSSASLASSEHADSPV